MEVINKSTHITVEKGSSSNGYVGYYALAVYNSGDTFTSKLSNNNGYIVYTDGEEKIASNIVDFDDSAKDKGIYYYITYDNSCITAVDMYKENLDGKELVSYPMVKEQQIIWQNKKAD